MRRILHWLNWERIYNWIGACAGMMLGLMGGWDKLLGTLVILMALDYVSGLIAAIAEKKVSSAIGFIGLAKKLTVFVLLIAACQLDILLNQNVCRTTVGMFYAANEVVSITENACRLGLPVPKKLMAVLAQMKGEDEA